MATVGLEGSVRRGLAASHNDSRPTYDDQTNTQCQAGQFSTGAWQVIVRLWRWRVLAVTWRAFFRRTARGVSRVFAFT